MRWVSYGGGSVGHSLMLEGQEGVTKIELLAGEVIPKVGT